MNLYQQRWTSVGRGTALLKKFHTVKAMFFPAVMYRCECWAIKDEHQRIDAFELWCWRRLLRVPWTAGRSNQSSRKSTLSILWKDWYWSWSSDTLSIWCQKLLTGKDPWCWERLKAGEKGGRGSDGYIASVTLWIWIWALSGREWQTGKPVILHSMGLQRVRRDLVTEQQQQQS